MPTSEARIRANQANSAKSTGPKTVEGKQQSRRNALKHGLTGAGVVLPNEDVAEVERRFEAFRDDLQPSGEVGEVLARRAAFLSVRLERCVSEETARLSGRIRQADADFVPPEATDASTVAQLKAEAKARAMFDPSPEASRARSYEAAAERGFFRALKEIRELQKKAQVAEPTANSEEFDRMLASFSQFNDECDAFEAEHFDADLRTPSTPPTRPISTSGAPLDRFADVPFTIGRPN